MIIMKESIKVNFAEKMNKSFWKAGQVLSVVLSNGYVSILLSDNFLNCP